MAFNESYAGLSDVELMEPGVTGAWSVRDILAHVTTWEEEALKHLPLILKGGTPPRLGFGSAARARSERTAVVADAGRFSDHAVSAAPAAAVLRNRPRFTRPPRRGWSMPRALLWGGARLPYARGQAVVNRW